jgi:hypothetical protein
MIQLSDLTQSILGGTYTLLLTVDSWLGGQLLAADIPMATGTEEVDRTLKVPERVSFTVPRLDRGMSWSPVANDHPLAANGQRLRVSLGIDQGNNRVEWFTRGWYLIQDSDADGDTVTVTAVGLLTLVDEARMVTPYQPTGTLTDTLRGLIEPALTVVVDGQLADRDVPAGINYDLDRLQAVLDLLDAWPATGRVDPNGFLDVTAATIDPTPVLSLTNGAGGTIITATGKSTREGAFNMVVAQGTAADGGQVQGIAQVLTGPRSVGGPFNPLDVPYFYSSPLLTDNDQCAAAAQTRLDNLLRENAIGFDVQMVPHPGLQDGDVVTVTTDDYTDLLCTVEYLSLPLTAGGGSQKLTVRSLA